MTPLNNQVFIRPDFGPDKIGSIIMPHNLVVRDLPNKGEVVAIAKGANAEFKVGDTVIYDRHKSDISHVKDENGLVLARVKVEDVMAVLG